MVCDFMRRRRGTVARAILLTCFLLSPAMLPHVASAQTVASSGAPSKWDSAVAELAEKIVAVADATQPATLEVKNISTLNAADVSAIGQELQAELGKHVRLVSGSEAKAQIVVTLSEGASGYVWVAQVRGGSGEHVAMVSIPKEAGGGAARRGQAAMTLQRKLVWSQPQQFLDFTLTGATAPGTPGMIVLEPSRIVFYNGQNGQWVAGKAISLHAAAPLPRDARGMIWETANEIDMLIPGESCSGTMANLPDLACAAFPSTNPGMNWPLVTGGAIRQDAQFESDRDFFHGFGAANETDGSKRERFYTAAAKDRGAGLDWVLAEMDGKARLYEGSSRASSATFSGWGDEIATIGTGCSDSWDVLTTGTGDWTQGDHIQIYEIRDSQANAAGQPLEFPGPILALWSASDLKTARVVSLNLQTGMYEASIITVTCGE